MKTCSHIKCDYGFSDVSILIFTQTNVVILLVDSCMLNMHAITLCVLYSLHDAGVATIWQLKAALFCERRLSLLNLIGCIVCCGLKNQTICLLSSGWCNSLMLQLFTLSISLQ